MTLKKTLGSLTKSAANTAASVARNPIGSASTAAGLVKGAAEAGLDLVRESIAGHPEAEPAEAEPSEARETTVPVEDATAQAESSEPAQAEATSDPRDIIPGPDLAQFSPPAPEDLPEPIVIEAEPAT